MELYEYVRRLPKAELHVHLAGCVRPKTLFELAAKRNLRPPVDDPDQLYGPTRSAQETFALLNLVAACVRERDDFARVAYEALVDEAEASNLRYREMFFNPTNHLLYVGALKYTTMIDGLIDGIRAAETDAGVICRLIPGINRTQSPDVAVQLVQTMLAHPRPEVIGVGLDENEVLGPARSFEGAYRLAREGGLRVTAHAAEWDFPGNVRDSIEILGCRRIDHGYHIADDAAELADHRRDGVHFTTCWTNTVDFKKYPESAENPIAKMIEAGLSVSVNTDDPQLMCTTLTNEYYRMAQALELSRSELQGLALEAVDAGWLDDEAKASLRQDFERELATLDAEFIGA